MKKTLKLVLSSLLVLSASCYYPAYPTRTAYNPGAGRWVDTENPDDVRDAETTAIRRREEYNRRIEAERRSQENIERRQREFQRWYMRNPHIPKR